MKQKILLVFGTRPEAIKLAPIYFELKKYPKLFDVKICLTSQHKQMLYQVMNFFGLKSDFDLKIMKKNQTLFEITSRILEKLKEVLDIYCPDIIIIQGDTTTAFVGALAGFYKKIKIVHIEAGLRSHEKYSPFPEEINRILISRLTDYNFVPTAKSFLNLKDEGITENVWSVGNPVIDSLLLALAKIKNNKLEDIFIKKFKNVDFSKKIILVTGHRRENLGKPLENICRALKYLSQNREDIEIVYPVHLNPNVVGPVNKILGKQKNIHLIEPLDYPEFVWLMNKSYLIITDSGGVQEEAPALGKPVLVTREVTERQEGVEAGTAKLVGNNKDAIIKETLRLLNDDKYYLKIAKVVNSYGDGKTSQRIVEILKNKLTK